MFLKLYGGVETRIYDGASFLLREAPAPMVLDLSPMAEPVHRVCVRFVTPTELKSGQRLAERPEFPVLAERIRDRLSKLRERYDDGPLTMNFRGFGERASQVRMTRCEIRQVMVERRSGGRQVGKGEIDIRQKALANDSGNGCDWDQTPD